MIQVLLLFSFYKWENLNAIKATNPPKPPSQWVGKQGAEPRPFVVSGTTYFLHKDKRKGAGVERDGGCDVLQAPLTEATVA